MADSEDEGPGREDEVHESHEIQEVQEGQARAGLSPAEVHPSALDWMWNRARCSC